MNSLLGHNIPPVLPNSVSPASLAASFLNFFSDKITQLCASIPSPDTNEVIHSLPEHPPPAFASFDPCTVHEIRTLILSSTDATCSLDIIPTKLLKSCVDALASPITHLINLSLSEGLFPEEFKHAIVSPLLKKPSLPK